MFWEAAVCPAQFAAAHFLLPVAEPAQLSGHLVPLQIVRDCPCCWSGIKVDKGVVDLPGTDRETTTQASTDGACACCPACFLSCGTASASARAGVDG